MKQTDRSTPTVCQKKTAVQGKGGLVHGAGGVKPDGTTRRSDSNSKQSAPEPAPLEPLKKRLVTEQGPAPLYYSDECRLADLNASNGFAESYYHPNCQSPSPSPPPVPVPHNSFFSLAFSTSQVSESDSSSSTDSSLELTDTDRCHAHLALPTPSTPPAPLTLHSRRSTSRSSTSPAS